MKILEVKTPKELIKKSIILYTIAIILIILAWFIPANIIQDPYNEPWGAIVAFFCICIPLLILTLIIQIILLVKFFKSRQ